VFDDQWAGDMELPTNQHTQLRAEKNAWCVEHHVMTYVHDAKGFWFDR
jgi:hypothetical protein